MMKGIFAGLILIMSPAPVNPPHSAAAGNQDADGGFESRR